MTEVDDSLFWAMAAPHLEDGAERSTMMGFPCLRIGGKFFATLDHKTGDLIVKLEAERVDVLIESGTGAAFAPAGRRFKEWVTISNRDPDMWLELLDDARAFVSNS